MVITIQVKGLDRLNKLFTQLPKTMEQEIMKKSDAFMRFVQKSARLRAPRATGQLAQSIRVRKIKKNEIKLTVESPYGAFQEKGFLPHWISRTQHSRAGYRFEDWLAMRGYTGIKKLFLIRRFKPFIQPALEVGLSRLPNMLKDGAEKAIKRAGG